MNLNVLPFLILSLKHMKFFFIAIKYKSSDYNVSFFGPCEKIISMRKVLFYMLVKFVIFNSIAVFKTVLNLFVLYPIV